MTTTDPDALAVKALYAALDAQRQSRGLTWPPSGTGRARFGRFEVQREGVPRRFQAKAPLRGEYLICVRPI
jgi:hypothetical protein